MEVLKNTLDQLTEDLANDKKPICHRCKEEIIYSAFMLVTASIINLTKQPMVYAHPVKTFNFNQQLLMHDYCWIKTLREHGSVLYDIEKIGKELQEQKDKLEKGGGK